MTNSYVAIDLEMTGLSPKRDKIIEIGAVRVADGQAMEEYSSLVNPGRRLEEQVTALTGITDEMVAGAPRIEDIIGQVVDFCGALPLLGHSIMYDYRFLERAAFQNCLIFQKDGIDTLEICKRLMPADVKKNLSAACEYYQVDNEHAHRALSDAYAAHRLYQAMILARQGTDEEVFFGKRLVYRVKKDQPASKSQKDHLRDLLKYHRICLSVQFDCLTRSEASRITDKIISKYGRILKR